MSGSAAIAPSQRMQSASSRSAMLAAFGVVRYAHAPPPQAKAEALIHARAHERASDFSRAPERTSDFSRAPHVERAPASAANTPKQALALASQALMVDVPVTTHVPAAVAAHQATVNLAPAPKSRSAGLRAEFVLPAAELARFAESKLYRHLCVVFGSELPIVENAVLSDSALHFESPDRGTIRLGSINVLRQTWRSKRQAWIAIRLWRKQRAMAKA